MSRKKYKFKRILEIEIVKKLKNEALNLDW